MVSRRGEYYGQLIKKPEVNPVCVCVGYMGVVDERRCGAAVTRALLFALELATVSCSWVQAYQQARSHTLDIQEYFRKDQVKV